MVQEPIFLVRGHHLLLRDPAIAFAA